VLVIDLGELNVQTDQHFTANSDELSSVCQLFLPYLIIAAIIVHFVDCLVIL